jgi:hypothetical protein
MGAKIMFFRRQAAFKLEITSESTLLFFNFFKSHPKMKPKTLEGFQPQMLVDLMFLSVACL